MGLNPAKVDFPHTGSWLSSQRSLREHLDKLVIIDGHDHPQDMCRYHPKAEKLRYGLVLTTLMIHQEAALFLALLIKPMVLGKWLVLSLPGQRHSR